MNTMSKKMFGSLASAMMILSAGTPVVLANETEMVELNKAAESDLEKAVKLSAQATVDGADIVYAPIGEKLAVVETALLDLTGFKAELLHALKGCEQVAAEKLDIKIDEANFKIILTMPEGVDFDAKAAADSKITAGTFASLEGIRQEGKTVVVAMNLAASKLVEAAGKDASLKQVIDAIPDTIDLKVELAGLTITEKVKAGTDLKFDLTAQTNFQFEILHENQKLINQNVAKKADADQLSVKATNGAAMFRLYNPNSGEHFYTKDAAEKAALIAFGWKDEEIGWYAPVTSKTPVYRLYNQNAGDHHYTKDVKEKDALVALGWKDEGIGWYSVDNENDGAPLLRSYNPNATTGSHNYTLSTEEHDHLVSLGWKDEGTAWHGLKQN